MSGGMAKVIAAHQPRFESYDGERAWLECACRMIDNDVQWRGDTDAGHAAHVAEELAKAGYGLVQEALMAAADEMEQERATWCLDDSGRHWISRTLNDLRARAHSLDPEGRALVQAIRERKAEA